MWRVVVVGTLALLALLAGAAGACKLTPLYCHLREPERDDSRGRAAYGRAPTQLPPGFRQEVAAAGLAVPTSFALLPDDRILIAEKKGAVRVVRNGRLLPRPLLDLRRRVNNVGYRGLLAVEPDPAFERNGFLYLLYVREDGSGPQDAPRTVRVSRVTVRGNAASAASERVLLGADGRGSCNDLPRGSDCIPCDGDHCGGDLEFGSDGALFVSTGDGWNGSAGFSPNALRPQRLDSLGGKLLRVTREGRGLPDNPFWTGDADAVRSKVWAYGLRNPFRFTLRRPGDVPYVGDVGWNEWEEIDAVPRGANLGWPCFEARVRPDEYRLHPICAALYRRGPTAVAQPLVYYGRGSVTGGVFYDGDVFPQAYRDAYVYGDWSRHVLRVVRPGERRSRSFARNAAGPVELQVAADGSLYYLATNAGELRRIVYESP